LPLRREQGRSKNAPAPFAAVVIDKEEDIDWLLYATHKHPAVTRWLDRHARFHMHYTPTSSSWINLVERFFRDLTEFITEKSFA
jgi:hypothetical protein